MDENNDVFSQLPGALLPWYQENKRDLPWRADRDPYHVWLSEVMLQQTRVEAVKGYYTRFLEAVPDVAALATCDDNLLHKLWEGLGYYSRVRNLKKSSQIIMECFDGHFPRTFGEIRALPGIGEYTAGAICSICFDMPTPAVDGNVLRVTSRLTENPTPIDLPKHKNAIRDALAAVYPEKAGAFTQALMELGATLCGPNWTPRCSMCPCQGFCASACHGTTAQFPVKMPKKEKREECRTVFICFCDGRYALEKRPDSGLMAGLWQFPNLEGKLDVEKCLIEVEKMGLQSREILRTVERKHIFTHIRWEMHGIYLEVDQPAGGFTWLTAEQINANIALPTAFRQFWEEINQKLME